MKTLMLLLAVLALTLTTSAQTNTPPREVTAHDAYEDDIELQIMLIDRRVALKHYEKIATMIVECQLQQRLEPSPEVNERYVNLRNESLRLVERLTELNEAIVRAKVRKEKVTAAKATGQPQG